MKCQKVTYFHSCAFCSRINEYETNIASKYAYDLISKAIQLVTFEHMLSKWKNYKNKDLLDEIQFVNLLNLSNLSKNILYKIYSIKIILW